MSTRTKKGAIDGKKFGKGYFMKDGKRWTIKKKKGPINVICLIGKLFAKELNKKNIKITNKMTSISRRPEKINKKNDTEEKKSKVFALIMMQSLSLRVKGQNRVKFYEDLRNSKMQFSEDEVTSDDVSKLSRFIKTWEKTNMK
jgi:hypothetical protein